MDYPRATTARPAREGGRLGSLQRHRGCRSRHPACAIRLFERHHRVAHLRGGAGHVPPVAAAEAALGQRVDADGGAVPGERHTPRLRLPLRQQLAVHGILTAGVLGLLLYPASLVVVAWGAAAALDGRWPTALHSWALLGLNLGNLVAVLAAAVIASLRGLRAARSRASRLAHRAAAGLLGADVVRRLAGALPILPDAFAWEKTTHGVARDRRRRRRQRLT